MTEYDKALQSNTREYEEAMKPKRSADERDDSKRERNDAKRDDARDPDETQRIAR